MKRTILILLLMLVGMRSAAYAADTRESLYDLHIQLTDQQTRKQPLDLYRGHPVLIAMFYGSCSSACPLLIEAIRANERAAKLQTREQVRVLLVSIDPRNDTPAALSKLAIDRHIDTTRWTLATASDDDVRSLAATLGVQYRRLPNGDYNHTSVITLLTVRGEIEKQTSTLAKADAELVVALNAQLLQ